MTQTRRPGSRINREEIVTCKRCGTGGIYWAVSSKTGRSYLAHAARSNTDYEAYYCAPWALHKCSDVIAKREADNAAKAQQKIDTIALVAELRSDLAVVQNDTTTPIRIRDILISKIQKEIDREERALYFMG